MNEIGLTRFYLRSKKKKQTFHLISPDSVMESGLRTPAGPSQASWTLWAEVTALREDLGLWLWLNSMMLSSSQYSSLTLNSIAVSFTHEKTQQQGV